MSSKITSTAEELAHRDIAMWNDHAPERVRDLYARTATYHDSFGETHDRTSMPEYVEMALEAFPDLHVEPQETIVDGDRVAIRYTLSGTHDGLYRGFEPTGKSFEIHGTATYRVEDGAITEAWNAVNSMAVAQQLGLLD